MIAIITPHFSDFHYFTKFSPFDGFYFQVKFIDRFKSVFGQNFDGYIILPHDYHYDLKDGYEIIEYLEIHGAKRINL